MTPEEKKRECGRAYYAANAEKIKVRALALYHSKKQIPGFLESMNARFHVRWKDSDFRDKVNARQLAAYHDKKQDPNFRMRRTLRSRLQGALEGRIKSARTLALLGCTIEFLREHLEKQFQPGMTWENYGPVWHVDHILPCATFHLQHSEEQEICFNWSNLQPLFAKDNISKSDKIL